MNSSLSQYLKNTRVINLENPVFETVESIPYHPVSESFEATIILAFYSYFIIINIDDNNLTNVNKTQKKEKQTKNTGIEQ